MSESGCPNVLKSFFENEESELWLWFVHGQLGIYEKSIREIEKQNACFIESLSCYNLLLTNVKNRKDNNFVTLQVKTMLKNVYEDNDPAQTRFYSFVSSFYNRAHEYLVSWGKQFSEYISYGWCTLKNLPLWSDVETSIPLIENAGNIKIDSSSLFDEFELAKIYITEKLSEWNSNNVSVENRWVETFKVLKEKNVPISILAKVVEFLLCLPGSNAGIERLFSKMNYFWTSEKTNILESTVGNALTLQYNLHLTCSEMYDKLMGEKHLCEEIHKSQKYNATGFHN